MTMWASPPLHVSLSFSIILIASSRSSQHRITEQTTCKELSRCLKALKPSSLRTRQLFLNTFLRHVLSNRMPCLPEAKWRPFWKCYATWFPLFLGYIPRLPQNCFVSVQQLQDKMKLWGIEMCLLPWEQGTALHLKGQLLFCSRESQRAAVMQLLIYLSTALRFRDKSIAK